MTTLKFTDTHNMVAFLSKHTESDEFEQIMDFLNAHLIRYALTINPTIYISCIEQFWSTVKAKTINGEARLHDLVDGKKIIITESSVRRDLQLADEESIDCLSNSTIFEQLALMGPKTTAWNEFSSTMASVIIYEVVHKELGDSLVRAATTASSLEAEHDSGNINKTRSKATPNESSSQGTNSNGGPRGNTLRSDKDKLKLKELMALCTNLQNKVLDLEKTKTTQQNEIASLKRRVKKLEKKNRSRTHKLKRLYKVGLRARVESFDDEESLGEDASKQGRINYIDADEEITLVSVHNEMEVDEEVVEVINTAKLIIDAAQVSAVGDKVSAASAATTVSTATTTTATTVDDITLAQDKGKGIWIEPVKPMQKKDQISFDEETTLKLQAEFDEEEKLAREKDEKEQEANIALIETWDDIQAKIDADHQLDERFQAQEQEELSIEEKATLFQQLLEKRRKYFAAKRAEEIRNKPPTKS
ncbi:hypothetical protein Tco_1020447 [Tanacetum coccineum]